MVSGFHHGDEQHCSNHHNQIKTKRKLEENERQREGLRKMRDEEEHGGGGEQRRSVTDSPVTG
jgi:hypothetical protein